MVLRGDKYDRPCSRIKSEGVHTISYFAHGID